MESTPTSSDETPDFIPRKPRKSEAVPKTEVEIAAKEVKTKPAKRPQSEKQKEATKKMLGALKERRETMKKSMEEEAEMLKAEKDELKIQANQRDRLEKAKLSKKKLPPVSERPTYITAAELQRFKLEVMEAFGKPQTIVREKEVEVLKEIKVPVITEKIVEKPTTKVISGNALLDAIFFK